MQTKRKKSRYVFWKTEVLFATLFFAALLFAGCSVEQTNRTKISDLDYTIAAEADIPEELQNDIEEKKAADFKMTYKDNESKIKYTQKTEKIFSITHIFKNINIYPSVYEELP